MKKSIFKNLRILLLIPVVIVACKKAETGGNVGPNPTGKRLIKTEISATDYSVFDYNQEGGLSKVTEYEEGSVSSVLSLSYVNKKLKEAGYSSGEKMRFVYKGENIDSMKIYSSEGDYVGYVKYTYEGNKNTKQSHFYANDADFKEMLRSIFTFSENGNVNTQTTEIFDLESKKWVVYGKVIFSRFDNKINPLSLPGLSVLSQISGAVHKNNVEEQKIYEAGNTLSETRLYTYTYDNDGYPVLVKEKTITTEGEETETTKYVYN